MHGFSGYQGYPVMRKSEMVFNQEIIHAYHRFFFFFFFFVNISSTDFLTINMFKIRAKLM